MEALPSSPEPIECERCHRTSTLEAAFVRRKRAAGGRSRGVCFECEGKRQVNSILFLTIFSLVFACFNANLAPNSAIGNFYLLLFWGLLACIPLLVLHELAHAAAARLLGFRVFAIHLGMGGPLLATRFLGLTWVIHPAPVSAVTVIAGPELGYYRLRLFFITLAGPGLHALLAAAAWFTYHNFGLPGTWYLVLFWTNVFLLAVNLFPRKALVAVGATGTDGLSLLQIPRMGRDELQKRFAGYYLLGTVAEVERGDHREAIRFAEQGAALYPGEPNILNALGYARIYTGEYSRSRDYFLQALALEEKLTPAMEAIMLNNVAFADLLLDDPALLPEADAYSDRACQAYFWEPAVLGTRGGVLIALDQAKEGLDLLRQSLEKGFEKRGKASDACLIAWGEMKLGRPAEAEKYLALARRLDPLCPLLDFANRKMGKVNSKPLEV
ncbi:MAG: site-2 protease family protein [Chloroflexota bacterium]